MLNIKAYIQNLKKMNNALLSNGTKLLKGDN